MPDYLSLRETAIKSSLSERTIRKFIKDGMPHRRTGKHGKILIRWDEFEDWLERISYDIKGDAEVMEFLKDLAGVA